MVNTYTPPYYQTCCGDGEETLGPRHSVLLDAGRKALDRKTAATELVVHKFISEADFNHGLDMWLPRPGDVLGTRKVLRDSVFVKIGELLQMYGKGEWSLRPRTFAILRAMGCCEALDKFIKLHRNDSFLPYNDENLPDVIKGHDKRAKFLSLQDMVLCRQDDISALEVGGTHLHLHAFGDTYFTSDGKLGEGGFGKVYRVHSRLSLREYALKLIYRGVSALKDAENCRQFESELQALKRLSHRHIVRLVGSYTDAKHLGLIMTPIADMNLNDFLRLPNTDPILRKRQLRSYFGCLATALAYLHTRQVRHNDIKPHNVLLKDSSVYMSDFGTSRIRSGGDESTTPSSGEARTHRYCAPEAYNTGGGRNRASDIWSLGCVFLEMATVLLDRSLEDLDMFLARNGSLSLNFWANHNSALRWIETLREAASRVDAKVLDWAEMMLQYDPQARPTAGQLRGQIIDFSGEETFICHDCSSPTGLEPPRRPSVDRVVSTPAAQGNDSVELYTGGGETPLAVTAVKLGLPERSVSKLSHKQSPAGAGTEGESAGHATHERQVSDTSRRNGEQAPARKPKKVVRFQDLDESRRPEPVQQETDDDDVEEEEFLRSEALVSPPFRRKDELPKATLAPSYILSGTNHFSRVELEAQQRSSEKNLFVYGRLMFPSVLRAVAAQSTKGAYSRDHGRRIFASSADWAKSDLSIRRASENMTPARLEGFDRWRPLALGCAVLQVSSLTSRILKKRALDGGPDLSPPPPGYVDGFLVTGLQPEALRYLDLLFNTNRHVLETMRTEDDSEDEDSEDEDKSYLSSRLLQRDCVQVKVETTEGEVMSVDAETYIWSYGIDDLGKVWHAERYLRSSSMQALLRGEAAWASEEQAIAAIMKIGFVRVGDVLVGPILEGDVVELEALLRRGFDPNADCRLYGNPLVAAVCAGNEDAVRLLLDSGADPRAVGGQYGTALIAAAVGGRKTITKILLHRGADVLQEDEMHVHALYQAVAHADYSVAEMLLDHSAWLCRHWGETLDLANELGDREIRNLLVQYDPARIHRQHRALGYCDDRSGSGRDPSRRRLRGSGDRDGRTGREGSWQVVKYSNVMIAVLHKWAVVQNMSGSWRGKRGVALTVAALDAGAPLKLIGLLREAMAPVRLVIEALKEGDERHERDRLHVVDAHEFAHDLARKMFGGQTQRQAILESG